MTGQIKCCTGVWCSHVCIRNMKLAWDKDWKQGDTATLTGSH